MWAVDVGRLTKAVIICWYIVFVSAVGAVIDCEEAAVGEKMFRMKCYKLVFRVDEAGYRELVFDKNQCESQDNVKETGIDSERAFRCLPDLIEFFLVAVVVGLDHVNQPIEHRCRCCNRNEGIKVQ